MTGESSRPSAVHTSSSPGFTEQRYQNGADNEWLGSGSSENQTGIAGNGTLTSGYSIARNVEQLNASRARRGAPPIQLRRCQEEDDTEEENKEEQVSHATGSESLVEVLEREHWNEFGFVLFRTFYRDEELWERFLDEYEPILENGLTASRASSEIDYLMPKICMNIVTDECMGNKIPAHVALAYRMFGDVQPGLRTKMCLIVDQECMRSVTERSEGSVPFVKAVDVTLGVDSEQAFPGVVRVAISSLLGEFYPVLMNCDTVWEIVPREDDIWKGLQGQGEVENGWEEIQGLINGASASH